MIRIFESFSQKLAVMPTAASCDLGKSDGMHIGIKLHTVHSSLPTCQHAIA